MHHQINNTTHTSSPRDQHRNPPPSPARASSSRNLRKLYTRHPLTGPSSVTAPKHSSLWQSSIWQSSISASARCRPPARPPAACNAITPDHSTVAAHWTPPPQTHLLHSPTSSESLRMQEPTWEQGERCRASPRISAAAPPCRQPPQCVQQARIPGCSAVCKAPFQPAPCACACACERRVAGGQSVCARVWGEWMGGGGVCARRVCGVWAFGVYAPVSLERHYTDI